MSRLLEPGRRAAAVLLRRQPPSRPYIAEMRKSALKENLLRILRAEIAYASEYHPPSPPSPSFGPFSIEDHPGEQWIRLRRSLAGGERLQVDATMFDGAAALPSGPISRRVEALEAGPRLHISLAVEVTRGEDDPLVLQFLCSAWPDALDVEKVFPVARRGPAPIRPYLGLDFRKLDDEMQGAVRGYLEEMGVDDDLAEFLQGYMTNKDKTELLLWLKTIESFVKR